ncbi:type III-A CRISPR-associated RAMP protein Csm3 [Gallibacterium genomosp. 3]|uniref:CRISPR system Cms endoribonuclease Csm3 n=1 Tax=Gallibacterium genomosp. 3 TaxID=505345 RepID=A0A1A7Q5H0_9PAST|nr:type III-A CRISPR-associated RAMP protein Csm3 [Gallibacterium genomosp. 3]OBX09341.1 CRISPR-associated protein [Gallibacterium genomosp. 3]
MKLQNIVEIQATLVLKTGLHIGAGDSEMHIGGIDNSVIKNPITGLPYIPGSSLKGKIRSLLEWRAGIKQAMPFSLEQSKDNEAVKNILRLFGISGDTKNQESQVAEIGVSRLAFWDCEFTEAWKKHLNEENLLATEAKSENTIDRITSTAGHPRQTERVPAGAEFTFKVTLRQFEGDPTELKELLLKGLRLLELDSLGGSGSRGYGKVEFKNLTINGESKQLANINPFA